MKLEKIAINSVSTRSSSLEDSLDAYAEVGFTNVELALRQVKEWFADGHDMAELGRMFESRRLRCIGGFEAGVCAFGDERRANRALHIDNARLFAELGGGTMVVGTDGPADATADPLEALKTIGQTLADLAEAIDPSVSLAVEFNWSPIVRSIRSAKRVVDAAGHERVGILFDPAHYHCTPSKLEDLTAETSAAVGHVHVDDMADKPGEHTHCNADRVLPGQGVIDLPAVLGRIIEHGYDGYFSLEMFSDELWQMPVREAARQMYESMAALCEAVSACTKTG